MNEVERKQHMINQHLFSPSFDYSFHLTGLKIEKTRRKPSIQPTNMELTSSVDSISSSIMDIDHVIQDFNKLMVPRQVHLRKK